MVGTRFTRGSGSSQSAAVVSGAAALLLQQRPGLSPDQVKALLRSTATPLATGDTRDQGQGLLDVREASQTATPAAAVQTPVRTASSRWRLEGRHRRAVQSS